MPYTITTKDGITINNIPDNVDPNSPELRARVAAIRAGSAETAPPAPEMVPSHTPFIPSVPSHVQAVEQPTAPPADPETTAAGLAGSAARGLGPYAAGTPFGPPGVAAVAAAKLVGDPLTAGVNSLLDVLGVDPKYHQVSPSEAMNMLMDKMGIHKPQTGAERVVAAGAEAAGSGLGVAKLGEVMAKQSAPAVAGIGETLAAGQAQQIAGGAGAGVASQAASEAGAGPGGQLLAGLAGGLVGAKVGTPRRVIPPGGIAPSIAESVPAAVSSEVAEAAPEVVGKLIKKASSKGVGSATAREKLAEMAAINPEAKSAAERLGIELPADVFSDNPQIRAAAGLTRSVAGSEAEGAWRTTVMNAVDKADEAIKTFDASFVEGAVSPGSVSQKVRDSLVKTRSAMHQEASKIYESVDASIPKQTPASTGNVQKTLVTLLDEVGEGGLSAQEKKLLKMVDSPEGVTYGRLMREKNLMGQAIAGKDSPYGNMEAASLKRLYAAMAEDQLANVESAGGPELRAKLRSANLLYAKERALGKRIINAFGEDTEGSIANRMRSAIASSSKGSSDDFAKLMKVVPDDLKRETVATAIASATRSARGAERGGFGFSEFAKTYQGLRANPPVYKQVVEALGPGSHEVMRDLYEVSKRITDARANVLTTGKANQALVGSMTAEGLVTKVMNNTVSKGVATAAGAAGGGMFGAAMASVLSDALGRGNKDALAAAGKMLVSDEFKTLAVEASTKPRVNPATVRKLATSEKFKAYAQKTGIPKNDDDLIRWILNGLRGQQATTEQEKK